MVGNYCSNCGAKLTPGAKFCHACGEVVGSTLEKIKKRKSRGWLFFFLALLMGFLAAVFSISTNKEATPFAIPFSFTAGIFYIAAVIEFFKWLFKKNKYVFWLILAIFIIIPLFFTIYYQSSRAYIRQIFEVQDIAAEVAYTKLIGDDLIQGKTISGTNFLYDRTVLAVYADEKITTWPQMQSKVQREYTRIKTKKVKKEVEPYRRSVQGWIAKVVEASNVKNPQSLTSEEIDRWNIISETPETVAFNLEENRLPEVLNELSSQVLELKKTGDNAFASSDNDTMRRVVARAFTQTQIAENISARSENICAKRGCLSEVRNFIPEVHRTAYSYLAGDQGAKNGWDKTWSEAPEIIKAAGTPLGGTGITQGNPDPTPPPNPTTTIRNVTPFKWPWTRPQAPFWDGIYQADVDLSCDAESGDFGDSFADSAVGNFEVRGGKIQGGAEEIEIDSTGHAYYSRNIAGINGEVNYTFTQTADGGVSLSGNISLYGEEEGASVSCTGDFSGSRISL